MARINVVIPPAMLRELEWHSEHGHRIRAVPTGRSHYIAWRCSCRIDGYGPIEVWTN